MEYFSKFTISFFLSDKEQKTELDIIKYLFYFYGIPKLFGTDNGREFINPSSINNLSNYDKTIYVNLLFYKKKTQKYNNYLNKNNVKLIKGLPYNPHSQCGVECIHLTIRNSLLALYSENSNDFNLVQFVKKVMNIYNRSIHSVTLYSPNEIFNNSNENYFEVVYDNILHYYEKNKTTSIFNVNEKCLINNNILFSKNKIKDGYIILKNKVKNTNNFYKKMLYNS